MTDNDEHYCEICATRITPNNPDVDDFICDGCQPEVSRIARALAENIDFPERQIARLEHEAREAKRRADAADVLLATIALHAGISSNPNTTLRWLHELLGVFGSTPEADRTTRAAFKTYEALTDRTHKAAGALRDVVDLFHFFADDRTVYFIDGDDWYLLGDAAAERLWQARLYAQLID